MAGTYNPVTGVFTPSIETVEGEISTLLASMLGLPLETQVPIDREWLEPMYQNLTDTSLPRYARKTTSAVAHEYCDTVGEEELRRRIRQRDIDQLAQPQSQPTPRANTDPTPTPPTQ